MIQTLIKVLEPDPAPGIKRLLDVGDPSINNKEDVAFSFNSDDEIGWLLGDENGWRKVIGSKTRIQGGKIVTMAYSQNPTNPMNNSGDLVFWVRLEMPDRSRATRVLLKKADSNRMIIAAKGMKGPFGKLGEVGPWPALNDSGDALVSIHRAHLLRKNFSAQPVQ
jgi:hypothetical protein